MSCTWNRWLIFPKGLYFLSCITVTCVSVCVFYLHSWRVSVHVCLIVVFPWLIYFICMYNTVQYSAHINCSINTLINILCNIVLYINILLSLLWGFPGGSAVKNPTAVQETGVSSLDQEDCVEEDMATCSNILAWRIPWTEESAGLQSIGLYRFGNN